MRQKAGRGRPAERRRPQQPAGQDGSEAAGSAAAGLRSAHGGRYLADAPLPGVPAEGDVKFLEGARRGPGEPLQREETGEDARRGPAAPACRPGAQAARRGPAEAGDQVLRARRETKNRAGAEPARAGVPARPIAAPRRAAPRRGLPGSGGAASRHSPRCV